MPRIGISAYLPKWSAERSQFVPGVTPLDADLYSELYDIKNGKHAPVIETCRSITDDGERKKFKGEKLRSLTISCVCTKYRNEQSIVFRSGCLCLDADDDHNPHISDWPALRDYIADRLPVVACILSASIKGIFFIVRIDPLLHLDTFLSIQYQLKKEMGITIDSAPKSPASLRYVSYDPDCFINPDFYNIPIVYPCTEYWQHKFDLEKKLAIARAKEIPANSAEDLAIFQNAKKEVEVKGRSFVQGSGTLLITSVAGYCNRRGMKKTTCLNYFLNEYGTTSYYTSEKIEYHIFDIYDRYTAQFGTVQFRRPVKKVPFYQLKWLLRFVNKDLLKTNIELLGAARISGQTEYTVKVESEILVFLMWLIAPEYTWTCTNPADHVFDNEACKDTIPANCYLDSCNGSRVWCDRKYNYPIIWNNEPG